MTEKTEINKLKKIKPMFNALVTTMDRYIEAQYIPGSNLIDTSKTKGGVKEYQTVLAVGSTVREIKVGDIVCINPKAYGVRKHQEGSLKDGVITDNPVLQYHFNVIELDGEECLLLRDNDIDFVVEEYE